VEVQELTHLSGKEASVVTNARGDEVLGILLRKVLHRYRYGRDDERAAPGVEGVDCKPFLLPQQPTHHARVSAHVPKCPPDVEAHDVDPEEGGQEEVVEQEPYDLTVYWIVEDQGKGTYVEDEQEQVGPEHRSDVAHLHPAEH